MQYTALGSTDLRISRYTLGTAFRQGGDEATARATIDAALDAGCNSFDTSNVYHTDRGVAADGYRQGSESEHILGRAMKGRRDRFIVTTKVGALETGDPAAKGLGRENIVRGCERSLQRLGTDYIDLYLCHFPDPAVPIDETLEALATLVKQGKVRHIGCSNFEGWRLCRALIAADDHQYPRLACNQLGYSLLDRRIEDELIPYAELEGIGITVFAPTAIGLLSGRYRFGEPPPSGTSWHRGPYNYRAAMTPYVGRVIDEVVDIAERVGRTPTQVALAWCLTRPQVNSVIIGCDTPDRARENLSASDWVLPPDATQQLDDVSDGLRLRIRKDAQDGYEPQSPQTESPS